MNADCCNITNDKNYLNKSENDDAINLQTQWMFRQFGFLEFHFAMHLGRSVGIARFVQYWQISTQHYQWEKCPPSAWVRWEIYCGWWMSICQFIRLIVRCVTTHPLHKDDSRLTYLISVSNNSLTTLSRIISLLCAGDDLTDWLKASANPSCTGSSFVIDTFRLSKSVSLVFGIGGMTWKRIWVHFQNEWNLWMLQKHLPARNLSETILVAEPELCWLWFRRVLFVPTTTDPDHDESLRLEHQVPMPVPGHQLGQMDTKLRRRQFLGNYYHWSTIRFHIDLYGNEMN